MITVEDDGKGIDAEKVKAKAIANNVISAAEADTMGENEAAKLIFHPGLSTADAVTNLSGRGVGMDVVKSTFEKLGGAIDLEESGFRRQSYHSSAYDHDDYVIPYSSY